MQALRYGTENIIVVRYPICDKYNMLTKDTRVPQLKWFCFSSCFNFN